MRFQALQFRVMKGLDGGFLNGAVHALGLPVRPRVIRFRQLVSNAVFIANATKDVHSQKGVDGVVSVFGQVCKSHAVVSENGVNLVGKSVNHAAQELCTIHLAHVIPKLHIGELGHPVNGQKHIELALGQAQLGNVNVHIANFSGRKLASATSFNLARWQPRDAMPEQAAMQARAAELPDTLA